MFIDQINSFYLKLNFKKILNKNTIVNLINFLGDIKSIIMTYK